jgi:hypothetical protein
MRLGLGLSISKNNGKFAGVGNAFVNAFKARVLADSGTFEGESYLTTIVNALSSFWASFSLFTTANAFKTSKLYSIIPNTTLGDLAYTRSSTATRVNQNGVVETMAANVPRIDWTYGYPVMLSETAATNIVLQSGFQSVWAANGTFTISNDTILGVASKKIFCGATQNGVDYNLGLRYGGSGMALVQAANSTNTGSFYFKKTGSNNIIAIYINASITGFNGEIAFSYNVSTLTATVNSGYGAAYTNKSAKIKLVSGTTDTYYCEFTYRLPAANSTSAFITFGFGIGANANVSGNEGTVGMFQIENGAYSSSYIPTTTATVTRTADSSNTTGLSSLIGQSEGTIYAEILVTQITADYLICALTLTGQSVTNAVIFSVNSIGRLVAQVFASSVLVVNTVNTPFVVGTIYKVAFGYKSGDTVVFVNGTQVGTTDTDIFTLTTLNAVTLVNSGYYVGGGQQAVKSIGLFPTRLSNSQLAALTT